MIEHGIRLDPGRESRIGLDEAIYAAGKSESQLAAIVADALDKRGRRLITRLEAKLFASLPAAHRVQIDYDPVSRTAILGERKAAPLPARVAVVTAGSSDIAVGREAERTFAYHGEAVFCVPDAGVAGLWRLLERVEALREMQVVIVAAGMDGALPSVVGGLVPGLVVALPTSVGYGVAEGGRVALWSALASCAPGIVTVNIDNGYGAACAALRALRLAAPKSG